MVTQQDINNYVDGALRYPLEDEAQLISMVILHFDIPDIDAERMVREYMKDRPRVGNRR